MAETRTREVTGVDPAQWMALLQQGDEEALERLLTHYDGMLRYIAGGILEAPQDREDCLAQVRLKLWESRGQYDPERSSPATWLTALCRNAAVDHLRRLQRQESGELPEGHPDPPPRPPGGRRHKKGGGGPGPPPLLGTEGGGRFQKNTTWSPKTGKGSLSSARFFVTIGDKGVE